MDSIQSVRRAISEWRRVHRRGPLPFDLRCRAGRLAAELGDEAVMAGLGLKEASVRHWREELAEPTRAKAKVAAERSFVELSSDFAALASRADLVVEVTGAKGRVVRIQGALDARSIGAILSGALAAEAS